jgi:hypothetical protein
MAQTQICLNHREERCQHNPGNKGQIKNPHEQEKRHQGEGKSFLWGHTKIIADLIKKWKAIFLSSGPD